MNRPPEIKNLVSSGGIVYRRSARRVAGETDVNEVALVCIRGGRIWSLPKGIIEKDEDERRTAFREVQEETGLKGDIVEKIGQIAYWYYAKEKTVKVRKTVHYFLMKYISGRTEDHDAEVDDAQWVPLSEAVYRLKYRGEKEIMQKAQKMIEKLAESPEA